MRAVASVLAIVAIFPALAPAHLVVALWNLTMPTIGYIRGSPLDRPALTFAPVVLNGRGAGGHRWSGLGVNVATF